MADAVSTRYKEALQNGHAAVAKGRPREAVQHYEEAGRLVADRPLPFVAMGSVYLQMRKPQDAIRAYEEALRRSPADLDAMRGMAQALEADGRSPEAAALAQRADQMSAMEQAGQRVAGPVDQRSLDLERHVAEARRAVAERQTERAIGEYLMAASGYADQNNPDAALDACYRALRIWPGAIDVHLAMAGLYLRRGWRELGVERVLLIDRRLSLDEDPARRAALAAVARDHRQLDPELERLAASAA